MILVLLTFSKLVLIYYFLLSCVLPTNNKKSKCNGWCDIFPTRWRVFAFVWSIQKSFVRFGCWGHHHKKRSAPPLASYVSTSSVNDTFDGRRRSGCNTHNPFATTEYPMISMMQRGTRNEEGLKRSNESQYPKRQRQKRLSHDVYRLIISVANVLFIIYLFRQRTNETLPVTMEQVHSTSQHWKY